MIYDNSIYTQEKRCQAKIFKKSEELQAAAENNLEFFDAKMQAVKVFYKTTFGLVEQLIPSPLQPADDPIVRVVMSRVFVDLHDGLEFGAATFGVNCKYKDIDGIYEITMPMEGEGVVVGGRETYGEPKKIANVLASKDGDACSASVERHGIKYIEFNGNVTESIDTQSFLLIMFFVSKSFLLVNRIRFVIKSTSCKNRYAQNSNC